MPVKIDIFDFKCFNQLRNGVNFDINLSEFTPNLVGNIGETLKVEFKANISQHSATEGAEEWYVDNVNNEIVRSSGSFLDDNVQVGDQFEFFNNWSNRKSSSSEYTGTVTFLSGDGRTLKYAVDSGSDTTNGNRNNIGLTFDQQAPANRNTALFLKFGLLENDETFNYQSKTTEASQIYYKGELVLDTPASAESLGIIKDWVTGAVTFKAVSGDPDFKSAQFIVSHTFILNPFYLLSYRPFIDSGTIPDLLAGDNALKYAAELEFRKTLTNTGSSKSQSFDELEGFTGWYGENFNGLNTKYEITSVAYEDNATGDPLDGINISVDTKVTVVVNNTGGSIAGYSCAAYLARVPTSDSQYVGTKTNLISNFLFKSEVVSSPATSSGPVTTSVVGGDLVIEYVVSYSTAEKLQLTTEDEFLLLVQIEDPIISAGNSDRTMLIAALNNYVDLDYLAGFAQVFTYGILQHGETLEDGTGVAALEAANEDGLLLNATFGVDNARNVVINNVFVKLLAYNATDNSSFTLDSYNFNIGTPVINGAGIQEINLESTRGYPLPDGDEFNLARIIQSIKTGDFQQYKIQVGQKIKWQDWLLNATVPDVFFDATKPNNNLNFKSSNYSGLEGYAVKLAIVLNLTGLDDLGRSITGDFTYLGGDIQVTDYDESTDGVTGVIQTFDIETGNSLSGNILYNGKDTLFKAVFANAASMQYGIHRIEPSQNTGDGIIELSSIFEPSPGSILKPLPGETTLKFDLTGSDLVTQCIIDGSKIQEGAQYKLSARTGVLPISFGNAFEFQINTALAGSAGDTFVLPLVSTGVYDFFVDWGDGIIERITEWDQAEKTHVYLAPGVYSIRIANILQGWAFGGLGDKQKILDITQWGIWKANQTTGCFQGCSNLNVTAEDTPDLSGATSLESFFNGCNVLVYNSSINNWDVSSATSLRFMFQQCDAFNEDLDNWDVSNVTNFEQVFFGCLLFNGNISTWDMSSATTLDEMFSLTGAFQGDLSAWDVSNVQVFFRMFRGCSFNQDISAWDVSSGTNFNGMFDNNPVFNQDISTWNMASATNTNSMFQDASSFNQPIGVWNTGNVTNMNFMFQSAAAFDQNLGGWDVTSLTTATNMFNNKALSTANYDALLIGWEAQAVNSNVVFNGGNSKYSAGAAATARAALVADHSWVITDGGLA